HRRRPADCADHEHRDGDRHHAPASPSVCHACPLSEGGRMLAALPMRQDASGVPKASAWTFVPAWMRGNRGSDSKDRSLGRPPHGGEARCDGMRRSATGGGQRPPSRRSPAKAPTDALTRGPGQQIIICCPDRFVTPWHVYPDLSLSRRRSPYMKMTH